MITHGKPEITINKKKFFKKPEESVFIPTGAIHRIENHFKKPVKIRGKVAKERTVINKIYAWELGKEYYDGNRLNGYGGFKYDGRCYCK